MKVVVIGGTSGIGKATADIMRTLKLAEVVAVGREECDVRDPDAVSQLAHEHGDAVGWVYSAGINQLNYAEDITEIDMFRMYSVNVMGFVRLSRELRQVRGSRKTSLVAVSSDAAERPMRTSAVYCGTKAALNQTVRCLAREFAPEWQVNAVAPGMTDDTEMTRYIDATVPELRGWTPEETERYEQSQSPIGRRGTPKEIGAVILDTLFSPPFMTGSIVTVNGGR